MKQHILVIGGTGKTGRRIVNILNKQGQSVRVGSRSATPAFDWHQPDGWAAALEGIDSVYITYQPDLAVPGALEAIEELVKQAKRAGVKRLVLLSGKGEREAQLCEQVVIHSGLDYTIIRANWFSQNFSESFLLEPIQQGVVTLPMANAKIPFVDAQDIAEVAAKALTEEGHTGQIYELTGDATYTFATAVAEIAKATGRSIQFIPVSLEAYVAELHKIGLDKDYVWLIEYLFTEVLGNPDNSIITQDIETILGRKPTTFKDYVNETARLGVWDKAMEV